MKSATNSVDWGCHNELTQYPAAPRLREMADIMIMPPPPHRFPVPFNDLLTKLGYPYAVVDPKKVITVLEQKFGNSERL